MILSQKFIQLKEVIFLEKIRPEIMLTNFSIVCELEHNLVVLGIN